MLAKVHVDPGARDVDDAAASTARDTAKGLQRFHPVAGSQGEGGVLGGSAQAIAILGVEKLHDAMKLFVGELLDELGDPAQRVVVGHGGASIPPMGAGG